MRLTGIDERLRLTGHIGGVPVVEFSPDGSKSPPPEKMDDQNLGDPDRETAADLDNSARRSGPNRRLQPRRTLAGLGSYENNEILIWSIESGEPVLALGERWPGRDLTVAYEAEEQSLFRLGRDCAPGI